MDKITGKEELEIQLANRLNDLLNKEDGITIGGRIIEVQSMIISNQRAILIELQKKIDNSIFNTGELKSLRKALKYRLDNDKGLGTLGVSFTERLIVKFDQFLKDNSIDKQVQNNSFKNSPHPSIKCENPDNCTAPNCDCKRKENYIHK